MKTGVTLSRANQWKPGKNYLEIEVVDMATYGFRWKRALFWVCPEFEEE